MENPKVSVLIPTLNAQKVLGKCLDSLLLQDYPKEKIEIIVADGGSSDETMSIAKKFGVRVINNPLKTGEAGKMAALKVSTGKYIALIDSDNILPDKDWLSRMIRPLEEHPEAVGSEPWEYVWRVEDGFITRYCAMIGMNDPLVLFLGKYDRRCLITNKWTEVSCKVNDLGDYLYVTFDKKGLPTIGANGTVFRADFLKKNPGNDYLFDIDILAKEIKDIGSVNFIKVKIGIIHTYCEKCVSKFINKQKRRVVDFLYHNFTKKDRDFDWLEQDIFGENPWGIVKFCLACFTVIPLLIQSFIGYCKKPDIAWFFHPLACELTFFVYSWYRVGYVFHQGKIKEYDRGKWSQ